MGMLGALFGKKDTLKDFPESKGALKPQVFLRCPLCGNEFERGAAESCAICPLLKRCGLVMCPHCSHEFPPD